MPSRCLSHVPALAISLLTALALAAGPATPRMNLQAFGTKDGLPRAYVSALLATRQGYLWTGSEAGLARFDGRNFLLLEECSEGQVHPSEGIAALAEGARGEVFALTLAGSLLCVEPGASRAKRIFAPPEPAPGLGLAVDGTGDVWMSLPEQLLRFREGRLMETLGRTQGWNGGRLALDGQNRLWAATRQGLLRLEPGRLLPGPAELRNEAVRRISSARDGGLWVYAHGEIDHVTPGLVLDRRIGAREGLPQDQAVWSLEEDAQGTLWVGLRKGLAQVAGGRVAALLTREQGLPDDWIASLAPDREGNLWVGTVQGGLVRARPMNLKVHGQGEGLPHEVVNALCEDKEGTLWIGTEAGLARMRGGLPQRVGESRGPRAFILSLAPDPTGGIWAGTQGGVARVFDGVLQWHTENGLDGPMTLAVLADRQGRVWAGGDAGLFQLRKGRFEPLGPLEGIPPGTRVHCLAEDAVGRIWAGTQHHGLLVAGEGLFAQAPGGPPVRSRVGALTVDLDGTVWAGTYKAGLWRWRGGTWTSFDAPQGLDHDHIYALLDDRAGSLWLGGGKGLRQISRASLDAVGAGRAATLDLRTWGAPEGMKDIEVTCGVNSAGLRTRDGHLWFATLGGAVEVDPAQPRPPLPPPAVRLEEVTLDGRAVKPGRDLTLDAPSSRLEFVFGGISFTAPERLRFRYALRGFDRQWVDGGSSRRAQYTNLPPGKYAFVVEASLGDGRWETAQGPLAFTIRPALWQRIWFFPALALLAGALVLAALRLKLRQAQAQEAFLKARVEEALASVHTLKGLLPVCAWCKKVRDDDGYWTMIENYIAQHTDATVSHGICPTCRDAYLKNPEARERATR
jgi:ligand-binding sensor domain-containing protein